MKKYKSIKNAFFLRVTLRKVITPPILAIVCLVIPCFAQQTATNRAYKIKYTSNNDVFNLITSKVISHSDTLLSKDLISNLIRDSRITSNLKINVFFRKSLLLTEPDFEVKNYEKINRIEIFKSQRKMLVYKDNRYIKTFPISLGRNPIGQKEFEGDGKTPEGSYKITFVRWKSPSFTSFKIDYPNEEDIERAKKKGLTPGSLIMIHGTSKGVKKSKDWTNGCIAISNIHMVEFRNMVEIYSKVNIHK